MIVLVSTAGAGPVPVCTPPPCEAGGFLNCALPDGCPGGCGVECAEPECAGDCQAPVGVVGIAEVVTCVNIGLETLPMASCSACDQDGDGSVVISEIITTVNIGLGLLPCGGPTPTPTPTPEVVCTPPLCTGDEVFHCPDECPGGCGTECATPTPQVVCTPPLCGEGEVFHCPGECPGGCGTECATPTPAAEECVSGGDCSVEGSECEGGYFECCIGLPNEFSGNTLFCDCRGGAWSCLHADPLCIFEGCGD